MKKHNSRRTLHQQEQATEDCPAFLPVIEERLHIDKYTVETGTVRISKQVTAQQEILTVPLVREEIQVERVPINQLIDSLPPAIRYEGETMIIPIVAEVAVVEKRLMLVEELRLIKRQHQKRTTESINLRKEAVSVEWIDIGRSHSTYRMQADDSH
ncbi:YsnF/AvaK domain-containing protein [Candidatus Methylomicrobium oryzae]|jgi:uncharacterized protein (TIGR02271 family)|uniref:YsnF/AvaK domain-containing protein n=1 Tax=Candidatus Methylomicrobium oryzae TaxID=2802053 RepID=UPI001923BF46|nr:YsnF/AvaK domain-containing protein [Methylomicrobium sp. RS1]MBL1264058.1 YsnF/AvaK domain-containing protein [Methylomicrobium sp. RS1]